MLVEPPGPELHHRPQARRVAPAFASVPAAHPLGSLGVVVAAPRAVVAPGIAAAFGAALLVAGRIPGSVLTAALLAIAARTAASAASADPPAAAGALARQARAVPAWVGIVVAAAIRAGSADLADIRGAHAVAGAGLAHGDPLMVASAWAGLASGVAAILLPAAPEGWGLVTRPPFRRLEILGVLAQALVVVAFFAGGQVDGWADLAGWAGGAAAVAVGVGAGRALAGRTGVAASALAALAVGLALAGERP